MTESITLAETPWGYQRSDELQSRFLAAAERLRELDGWPNLEHDGERELRANLVLEGGGVKGIGLVGAILALNEAGYSLERVAGTSAGAVTAAIAAAITQRGLDMNHLLTHLRSLDFSKFMPEGRLHEMLDHAGGHLAGLMADAAILTNREGLYSGEYLESWLRPIMHDMGVATFADLAIDDHERVLADERRYRLLVYVSDITRGRLTRLPWDYSLYGLDPAIQDPVIAVRASMSIPFFFEPVHVSARDTVLEVQVPGTGATSVHFAEGRHTWVDGALLAKYPIHSFDHTNGAVPPWPTIGIKLSRFQTEYPPAGPRESALAIAVRCLKTMMNEWDALTTHDSVAHRTIFVDSTGISATDFDLTRDQQDDLFLAGVRAATQYVIDVAALGGVPRR